MGLLCDCDKKRSENINEKEMSLIEINVDKENKINKTIEQINSIKKITLFIQTDKKEMNITKNKKRKKK
jgi:hypothetical protein